MAEEVRITGGGDDDYRVSEWEAGLPNVEDLTPLSRSLIPAKLASAFNIRPYPHRSTIDVNRASESTLSSLRGQLQQHPSTNKFHLFSVDEGGSNQRKLRRLDSGVVVGEDDSALQADDSSVQTVKRHRLVWTPQLHKRFIDVVAHLGLKNAVPKTIMQLMNVDGLTRENVASHLQKYRLYLKRMEGLSNEGPSSSDHLFAPHSSGDGGGAPVPIPMPQIVSMGYRSPEMVARPGVSGDNAYRHWFELHPRPYNMMNQQRDSSGHKFGSLSPYQRTTPNDK